MDIYSDEFIVERRMVCMRKMDNSGFTLMELIIVIGIMAVLVAFIVPNLTKYLARSRSETDHLNRKEIEKQVKNVFAEAVIEDVDIIDTSSADNEAQYIVRDGKVGIIKDGTTDFAKLLDEVIDDDASTKSRIDYTYDAIIITINGTISSGYSVKTKFVKPSEYASAVWPIS